MKQVVVSILCPTLVVTCLMVTANLAHAQAADARGMTPSTPPSANQSVPKTEKPTVVANPLGSPNPTGGQNSGENGEIRLCCVEVKDPKDEKHKNEVALGNYIVITLNQEWARVSKRQTQPNNKLGFFINDLFYKGLEPLPVPDQPKQVMFQLKRNDDNRNEWGVLFGRKSFFGGHKSSRCRSGTSDCVIPTASDSGKVCDCTSSDQISITVGLQDGSWAAKDPQNLCLEYLPDTWSKLVLPVAFLIAIGTMILGFKSSMLRDSGDPRTDGKVGTYSLARCQMALWFVTVVFAFLFTYAVTGDTSPIPQGTLILMGIGAGTAVGAAAIDLNKRTASKTDLINWTAERAALPQTILDLQTKIANMQSTLPSDPNIPVLQQQLQTAQQRLQVVSALLAHIPSTQVAASEGFICDVLSDVNGVSFHRVQVLGWTLVFWAVFMTVLFKKITLTDFDTAQLALMGISGSTYLGFKLQEKQS